MSAKTGLSKPLGHLSGFLPIARFATLDKLFGRWGDYAPPGYETELGLLQEA